MQVLVCKFRVFQLSGGTLQLPLCARHPRLDKSGDCSIMNNLVADHLVIMFGVMLLVAMTK